MKIKLTIFFLFTFFSFVNVVAQPVVQINDDDWTSSSTNGPCACDVDFNNGSFLNFFDAGGNLDYGPNENEEITLCPDASGSKMVVALFEDPNAGYSLNIHHSDTLFVYDGTSTSSPLLAKINDSVLSNGGNFPASWNNLSGCLTFQFISDGSQEGSGWGGNLSCANLIQPFTNHISAFVNGVSNGANDTINDLFPIDTGYVDVCLGDVITFIAEPYFPYEPGGDSASLSGGGYMQSNNYTTTWEISDGTTHTTNSFQFTANARNGYFVTLKVEDDMGQFHYSFCKIRVSTIPNFSTCGPLSSPICLGRTVDVVGGISSVDTAGVDPVSTNFPIGGVFGTQTYLPDGSGFNYTTDISISGFTPGVTIQTPSDIDQMCVKIEHSYLGDLEMMLTCPNGQSVNIFNSYTGNGLFPGGFGGGSTFLGGAYDSNTGNIGYCEEYCFSDSSIAMPSWASGYATTVATGPSNGIMVVPGLYNPEVSYFPSLQGCPINGTWTLTVRDNIGIDDGYICEWGIYFNSSLHPNSEVYAPSIVADYWQADSSIIADLDTVIVVEPQDLGPNYYTFVVEDEYGCTYDTTIIVQTVLGASITADTTTCDNFYQFEDNYFAPPGGFWFYTSDSGQLYFDDSTLTNPFINVTNVGVYELGLHDNFCLDTLYHQIEFLERTVNLVDTLVCDGYFQYDTILTDQGGFWFYTSDSGELYFDDSLSPSPYITLSQTGIYNVSVNDNFCQDTLSHNIEFFEKPNQYPILSDTVCLGDEFRLIVEIIDTNLTKQWIGIDGDVLSISDTLDGISTNYNIGSNEILLKVYNEFCNSTSNAEIFLETCEFPNVITPNGDGVNDFFSISLANSNHTIQLIVLNRWGSKVYQNDNYDNTWNGTDSKGNKLKNGTYYYSISVDNGLENFQGIIQIISN